VFWVRASDTASFENAFREIGQQLKIPGLENDAADVKTLVKTRLSQESIGQWLMIVDNADHFEMFYHNDNKDSGSAILSEYLPFSTLGAILFTTRDHEAAIRYAGSNVINIDEMDDTESRELLQQSLQNKQLINDYQGTTKLLELLAHLPLAIMQAAAYLNAKGSTISEYLRIYEESSDNTIKLLSKDFEDIMRYPNIKNPLMSMMNPASSLDQQGKYAEAEAMNRQTLQLQETVLGKDHPDTLMSMMNLASSLHQQGKYAEAEAMNRQTLHLQETVLGKDHPDTLMSMMNLAPLGCGPSKSQGCHHPTLTKSGFCRSCVGLSI
jgi:tetratricopeptide (TPR) repeat protein